MATVVGAVEGAIIAGAEATKQAREEMTQRIGTVTSHVETLGANFQGEAAVAFNRLMGQWQQDSSKVNSALVGFEEKLRAQQAHLNTGEQEQSSAFARVAARLGGN